MLQELVLSPYLLWERSISKQSGESGSSTSKVVLQYQFVFCQLDKKVLSHINVNVRGFTSAFTTQ